MMIALYYMNLNPHQVNHKQKKFSKSLLEVKIQNKIHNIY